VCRASGGRRPAPPFGLAAFTDDEGAAIAVLLDVDAEASTRAQVEDAAAQIPDAASLPAGRLVVVLPERAARRGLLGRIFGARQVPRVVRATALLARGYDAIACGADEVSGADLVWGRVPVTSLP
jgi:hypothetical protein